MLRQHVCVKKLIERNYQSNHSGQNKYGLPLVIVELASESKYELTGEGALKIVSPL